jgi:hypothetical protein
MEKEIKRIYEQAGHTVVFGNESADRTYSFTLSNLQPAHIPTALGSTSMDADGSVSNRGAAYLTRISGALSREPNSSLRSLGTHPANFGTALGRVAAHEMGHYLLQIHQSQHTSDGLMRRQFAGDADLYLRNSFNDQSFQFSPEQAKQLSQLCPQLLTTPTDVPGTIIIPRGGGRGGSGFGGRAGSGWRGGGDAFRWLSFFYGLGREPERIRNY